MSSPDLGSSLVTLSMQYVLLGFSRVARTTVAAAASPTSGSLAPQATARGGLPPNWGAAAAHGRHERQRRVGGGDSGERVRSR
uniref:Uncharacterized protein n=1 Tax=Oryza glaberrima TaxID=4538 RepID=I1Q1N7_ORYGL